MIPNLIDNHDPGARAYPSSEDRKLYEGIRAESIVGLPIYQTAKTFEDVDAIDHTFRAYVSNTNPVILTSQVEKVLNLSYSMARERVRSQDEYGKISKKALLQTSYYEYAIEGAAIINSDPDTQRNWTILSANYASNY